MAKRPICCLKHAEQTSRAWRLSVATTTVKQQRREGYKTRGNFLIERRKVGLWDILAPLLRLNRPENKAQREEDTSGMWSGGFAGTSRRSCRGALSNSSNTSNPPVKRDTCCTGHATGSGYETLWRRRRWRTRRSHAPVHGFSLHVAEPDPEIWSEVLSRQLQHGDIAAAVQLREEFD